MLHILFIKYIIGRWRMYTKLGVLCLSVNDCLVV